MASGHSLTSTPCLRKQESRREEKSGVSWVSGGVILEQRRILRGRQVSAGDCLGRSEDPRIYEKTAFIKS